MIDSQRVKEMRQRYDSAHKAVEVVAVHTDGGLFGQVPPEQAVALLGAAVAALRDMPTLLDAVERLRVAEYVSGPVKCAEGDCDEYFDKDGNELLGVGETCSHLSEKVATLADVKRAEYLDTLAQALKRAAEAAQRGGPVDERNLAEVVVQAVENTYDRITQWETTGEEPTW